MIAGVVLVFGTGLFLVLYTASPGEGVPVFARDRVAVLPLRGVITDDHVVIRQLREYRRDRSVKAFVLHVDSPGGEVAPSQSIYRELVRLREEGYPVVAAIGSVGASGAYYASLGADSILAMPGSLIGSIGVLLQFPNARALLEKVGVRYEVIKSAEHKDLGSPYRDVTEADRALLQALVDDVYGQFVDAIADERGIPRDSVAQIADGRLLSGRTAMEYGLIDAEGDLVDAIALAGTMAGLGPEPRVLMRQERRVGLLDLLMTALGWTSGRGDASLSDVWSEHWLNEGPRLLFLLRHR